MKISLLDGRMIAFTNLNKNAQMMLTNIMKGVYKNLGMDLIMSFQFHA